MSALSLLGRHRRPPFFVLEYTAKPGPARQCLSPVATGAARAHADAPDPAAPAMCACSLVPLAWAYAATVHHRGATNPSSVIAVAVAACLLRAAGPHCTQWARRLACEGIFPAFPCWPGAPAHEVCVGKSASARPGQLRRVEDHGGLGCSLHPSRESKLLKDRLQAGGNARPVVARTCLVHGRVPIGVDSVEVGSCGVWESDRLSMHACESVRASARAQMHYRT